MSQPNFGRVITTDVDELCESTKPWDVRITQLERGGFLGVREYILAGKLILYREQFNRRLLFNGVSPPGYFMFGSSASQGQSIMWKGKNLGLERIVSSVHSNQLDFTTPSDSNHVVLLIPEKLLQSYLGKDWTEKLMTRHSLSVNLSTGNCFRQLFGPVFNRYLTRPELLNNPFEMSTFESKVLGTLAQCLDTRADNAFDSTTSKRRQVLLHALECLDTTDLAINIKELAVQANVSQRTLEYTFKELLGVTPVRFDQLRRLNGTHKELCNTELDSRNTVTTIASRWGFTELGRFAVEYRRLFGEKPSNTLKKSRAVPSLQLADFIY